jgi:anti-anti-sigma factor
MSQASSEPFNLQVLRQNGISVVSIDGYLGAPAGARLQELIEAQLAEGNSRFLLDVSGCRLISSPGVGSLMIMAMRVVEDFQGDVVLAGADELKLTVLEMAGFFNLAIAVPSRSDGMARLGADSGPSEKK